MLKTITAALFLALIVEATSIAPGFTGMIDPIGPQPFLKSDKLQVRPSGQTCSQAAWPYYETNCVRGGTQPSGQPRETRVVVIDHFPAKHPKVAAVN